MREGEKGVNGTPFLHMFDGQYARGAPVDCGTERGALCGCGNSFGPSSFVSGLRVLAVKAEPPEVAPGLATSLTALAVDTAGAPVEVTWAACTEPALASNGPINAECFTAGPATFLTPLGNGLAITATAPAIDPTVFGPPDASGGLYPPSSCMPRRRAAPSTAPTRRGSRKAVRLTAIRS